MKIFDANISGSLFVSGSSNFKGEINLSGSQNITGSLNVIGSNKFIGDQIVTGNLIISGGLTVSGLNFSTDMVAGDIAYISTTGTVTPVTLIASKTTTSFTHTVPIATSAPGQYLMRIIFNGYTTYKRVTVTAS